MPADQTPMRWAAERDIETIISYHTACWHHSFASLVSPEVMDAIADRPHDAMVANWQQRLAAQSSARTVVAVDENDVAIGHVMVAGTELVHLFIDPSHHRRGLGRALLQVGERLIRQAGHDHAQLSTIVGNQPAIGLYKAHGWVVTDATLDNDLPNGSTFTEHVLRKDFDALTHVEINRANWDDDAANWLERGRRSWAAAPHWGEMAVPESTVSLLPDVAGLDVVELGCGTGYVSAWCLAAGAATAVGLDNSPGQLRSAQLLQAEFDRPFPLVWGNAEQLPFADNSFDVAVNEYGAALWCDPDRWIPEAARVLRPGGKLMFLTRSTLLAMALPDFEHEQTSTQLLHAHRGLGSLSYPDADGVEFARSHGDWISVLTASGFVVDRLVELYAPDDGPDRYSYFDAAWARQWPPEEAWCATYLG